MTKNVSKSQIQKERNSTKLKEVLIAKGYTDGNVPAGKQAHHIKPVAEGGKTTVKNVMVISKAKHAQIHKNRRKAGKI